MPDGMVLETKCLFCGQCTWAKACQRGGNRKLRFDREELEEDLHDEAGQLEVKGFRVARVTEDQGGSWIVCSSGLKAGLAGVSGRGGLC